MDTNSANTSSVRTKVFISYSHIDEKYLKRLLVHLKPLERAGITDVWVDTRIDPGQKWREEIRGALAVTKVAILLVSIDFINSEFIATQEVPPLLKAAEEEGVLILQVFVGSCADRWKRTADLNQFQAMNKPENPLSK